MSVSCTEQRCAIVSDDLGRHGVAAREKLRFDQANVTGNVISVEQNLHGRVSLETPLGVTRVLDMLSGEQLPRIC